VLSKREEGEGAGQAGCDFRPKREEGEKEKRKPFSFIFSQTPRSVPRYQFQREVC
jgi:hypothetical protein